MAQTDKSGIETKHSGTILVGFVISDKNGRPLFRYQKNDFAKAAANLKNYIYPVPKLAIITGGVADWQIGQELYRVKEGDIVLLRPSDIRHFSRIISSEPLTCEIYEFVPEFIHNSECIDIFRINSDHNNTVISSECENIPEILHLFAKIKEESEKGALSSSDMVRGLLLQALTGISRTLNITIGSDRFTPWSKSAMPLFPFEYSSEKSSLNSDHTLAMAYVLDIINRDLTGEVNIDSLADEVHMSRSHFCKIFRRYNGMSVNDYIIKARIEHTVKLILESGYNILDAAYASGFTSSSGFYKAFSKLIGTSPKEYLRGIKETWNKK